MTRWPFVRENGAHLVCQQHEMSQEPVDKIRQHCEITRACPGQHEWNKRGYRNMEVGYGTCLNVTSEHPNQLERHDLVFSGRGQMQT